MPRSKGPEPTTHRRRSRSRLAPKPRLCTAIRCLDAPRFIDGGSCVDRLHHINVPHDATHADLWKADPEDHDFGAARDYLSLVYEPQTAERIAEELRNTTTIHTYKAKDILRASQLRPLGRKNFHVRSDLNKITNEEKLSPVLLVRDVRRGLLVIADGFHRVCASRIINEDLVIPCRIITAP